MFPIATASEAAPVIFASLSVIRSPTSLSVVSARKYWLDGLTQTKLIWESLTIKTVYISRVQNKTNQADESERDPIFYWKEVLSSKNIQIEQLAHDHVHHHDQQ